MKEKSPEQAGSGFRDPERAFSGLTAQLASRLVGAAADVALVMDREGVILDVSGGDEESAAEAQEWLGRPWADTAALDSRNKVESILEEARKAHVARPREINQRSGTAMSTYRYTALLLGRERILAMGRSLAAIEEVQQQLINAQQSMDREYSRLRHAETRYRLLFQLSAEGVLIADPEGLRIADSNPAANAMVAETSQRLAGKPLASIFSEESWPALQTMLAGVVANGQPNQTHAHLAQEGRMVAVSASLFRQAGEPLLLVRVIPSGERPPSPAAERASRALDLIERMPDAFVVIDSDRRIQAANGAFLDAVQMPHENTVRGQPLDRWLGRPGVDLNLLLGNLAEYGSARNFATVVRGEFGSNAEAIVSAVSAGTGESACVGLVIRTVSSRLQQPTATTSIAQIQRSPEQLKALVGRLSLKEIVRESVDLIERLCIGAALDVSGDNRASAAQLLGLSRQSLYSKLRRHGLGNPEDEEQT